MHHSMGNRLCMIAVYFRAAVTNAGGIICVAGISPATGRTAQLLGPNFNAMFLEALCSRDGHAEAILT